MVAASAAEMVSMYPASAGGTYCLDKIPCSGNIRGNDVGCDYPARWVIDALWINFKGK
jgi:hypothetical protein